MEPTGCPETWVKNYHYSLPNTTEQRSSRDEIPSSNFTTNNLGQAKISQQSEA